MKCELSSFDKMQINILIDMSKDVYKIYEELIDLEVNGKYGSGDYFQKLNDLKDLVHRENVLFELISQDYDKNAAYMEYLDPKTFNAMDEKILTFIVDATCLKNNLVIARLFNRFSVKQVESRMDEFNVEFINKFTMYFLEDLMNIQMVILSQEIKKGNNIYEKKTLLTYIYNFRFLSERIENDSFYNNFAINDNPYLILSTIKDMYGMTQESFENEKIGLVANVFLQNIIALLNSVNSLNVSEYMSAILRQSTLRALLVILGRPFDLFDETVNFLKTYSGNNKLAEQMIMDVFDYFEEDKKIPQIVSFRL